MAQKVNDSESLFFFISLQEALSTRDLFIYLPGCPRSGNTVENLLWSFTKQPHRHIRRCDELHNSPWASSWANVPRACACRNALPPIKNKSYFTLTRSWKNSISRATPCERRKSGLFVWQIQKAIRIHRRRYADESLKYTDYPMPLFPFKSLHR